ncbi:MmgE/PrpD family protein [uncultured Tateyamaria sp.]|uniref:MmgE/PrpD family protein n=1 Tax=uncultured Tateyamaria sp. TaxID=455651 RepID=UPI00262C972A|nr:MmgE/PrpD family protein [uncultured Tateyamaria sp.]
MTFEDIAAFTLGPCAVPDAAVDMAATLLIDTLGVAAGADGMQAGQIACDHAVRFHAASNPSDQATLMFDGRRASLSGAAFAAATQIDNLDAHDGYNPTLGHIGCAVVPALCAFGEHLPDLSARDALRAMAMAYEVSARAAIALHASVADYHTSGAWNALGVAALGCRLRGATTDQLRHALGIAEYHGPRSQMMREIANPTMLHDGSGMGALVGTMAVLMAEAGFEGAPAITVEAADIAQHWADLGQRWTITQNYIKPYPICRWAHAALDGFGDLIDGHSLTAGDIAAIDVRTFDKAAALFPGMPETTSQAQYSLAFALGARLVHGRINADHISGAELRNAQVAAVVNKITVQEDARHTSRFPAGRWSDVTVRLQDGRTLSSGDVHARGGPEAPMALGDVEAKFHAISGAMPQQRKAVIWEMRAKMQEPDTKFSDLLALIHPPAGETT